MNNAVKDCISRRAGVPARLLVPSIQTILGIENSGISLEDVLSLVFLLALKSSHSSRMSKGGLAYISMTFFINAVMYYLQNS